MAGYERFRFKAGDLRPRDKKKTPTHYPIRARSIQYDLRRLRAVLNWGVHAWLLDRNGVTGYKVAEDGTPNRPVFTDPQYRKLLEVASSFPWQFGCLLVMAHETGHRLSAVLNLRWGDVDLASGLVTWRSENDKIGYQHTTPITPTARAAFEDARRHAPGIGDTYVLPGVVDEAKPVSPDLARDWMQRAQTRAGFELVKGRGWHAFRRNFASELRNAGLRDLCDLGGWKDPTTVIRSYQAPSEEVMRSVLVVRVALEA
jgi:integrase